MGRKRIIDCDAVLDAAERVVQRAGAANLTISAVAEAAGVSKATVLYDFKTKHALIGAIVARQIEADERRLQDCIDTASANPDIANPQLAGRLQFAAAMPDGQDRASVMTLCVALAADDTVRQRIRAFVQKDMATFVPNCTKDPAPLMAFLALQGYLSLNYFDFYTFPPELRDIIFANVQKMAQTPCTPSDDL